MAHQNFDKIFQENLNEILVPFACKVLGLPADVEFKKISARLPRTLERVPDFLKIAVLPGENRPIEVLHLEIQAAPDPEMVYRMLECKAILIRKTRLPVKQFVIFVGNGNPNMATVLTDGDSLNFSYQLLDFKTLDHRQFLNSVHPEEILLALLADFQDVPPAEMIARILEQLKKNAPEDLRLSKFVTQLELLSKLRNYEDVTIKVVEAMPVHFDLETDRRYMQGVEKGIERGIERGIEKGIEKGIQIANEKKNIAFVRSLLLAGGHTIDQIASLVGVDIKFVLNVKKEIDSKN